MSGPRTLIWKGLSRVRNLQQFLLDERRYRKWSVPTTPSALPPLSGKQLECQITKDYHRIEKGLSVAAPKRPFGADAQQRLNVAMKGKVWAKTERYHEYARDALTALEEWNHSGALSTVATVSGDDIGGPGLERQQAQQFFASRRSLRAFDNSRTPDVFTLEEAVRLATNSPSVCNRQPWRAHYYQGEDAQRVLKHQRGNRGFGESIPGLFIVSVDARLFSGSGERNQRWIDGGLFAMTLVWALHALGLHSCMLNWSRTSQDSDALRQEAGISESEDIIVLIAVGHPIEGYRVARSGRRELVEVFVRHDRKSGSEG